MNRDPEVYGPDAEEFSPDRHLNENGRLAPAPTDTHDERYCSLAMTQTHALINYHLQPCYIRFRAPTVHRS